MTNLNARVLKTLLRPLIRNGGGVRLSNYIITVRWCDKKKYRLSTCNSCPSTILLYNFLESLVERSAHVTSFVTCGNHNFLYVYYYFLYHVGSAIHYERCHSLYCTPVYDTSISTRQCVCKICLRTLRVTMISRKRFLEYTETEVLLYKSVAFTYNTWTRILYHYRVLLLFV